MVKKVIVILFFVAIFSCKKEEVVEEKIHFYISIRDFELKDGTGNSNEVIPNFSNKYTGGNVTFAGERDTIFFNTKDVSIEDYVFELFAGTYDIEIKTPTTLYGQSTPSFLSRAVGVSITDLTDTIVVNAEPTCALIVVKDDQNHLNNGAFIIERRSFEKEDFVAYPLVQDSNSKLYYTYLSPDTLPDAPNAFLWFYDDKVGKEKGGLHTQMFEVGYKYLIKVWE